jgi:hypothetical protein
MKWKPRMDESLRAIEANKECSPDVAFAFQVRLQLLAQKAVQFREQREWDFARAGLDPSPALSANFYIRTLQTQLHQLGDALPLALQERGKETLIYLMLHQLVSTCSTSGLVTSIRHTHDAQALHRTLRE